MEPQQIRVAIVCDNQEPRRHLVKILGKDPDIQVISEAETDRSGITALEEIKPDVILVTLDHPFTDGLETTETIVSKFEHARIIVLNLKTKSSILSLHSKHTIAASSCQAGACFPLCQDCTDKEILAAIKEGHQQGDA
jgi:DNA-binding NarL/FixJ family response regulator